MRQYEAIFIFRIEEDLYNKGKNDIIEEFKKHDIKIVQEIDMGQKDLAYTIKKVEKGHYINFQIEANPEVLKPLDKIIKLKSDILKYVFFKKE